jgi:hypothetical protein
MRELLLLTITGGTSYLIRLKDEVYYVRQMINDETANITRIYDVLHENNTLSKRVETITKLKKTSVKYENKMPGLMTDLQTCKQVHEILHKQWFDSEERLTFEIDQEKNGLMEKKYLNGGMTIDELKGQIKMRIEKQSYFGHKVLSWGKGGRKQFRDKLKILFPKKNLDDKLECATIAEEDEDFPRKEKKEF